MPKTERITGTPTAHAASHQNGGADEVATATPAANAIPKADAGGDLDAWVTTSAEGTAGIIPIASDVEAAAATETAKALVPSNIPAIDIEDLNVSDSTTNDVSNAAHGLVPKATDVTTNFLRADGAWAASGLTVNAAETLAATKTITAGGVYALDPGGASRDVVLALTAVGRVIVNNIDAYNDNDVLVIKVGATTYDTIAAGNTKGWFFDGTNYYAYIPGSGENDNRDGNTAFGDSATAHSAGSAFGRAANGNTVGTAIGNFANANSTGVALGDSADGQSNGTALGYATDTNGYTNAIALGKRSKAQRVGELAVQVDTLTTAKVLSSQVSWTATQVAENPVAWHEVFLFASGASRCTVRASSSIRFTGNAHARDTDGNTADYTVEGSIKRDGSNNTTLVAMNVTTVRESVAGWDLQFSADDTNEALKCEIKGNDSASSDTATVRFCVVLDLIEALD